MLQLKRTPICKKENTGDSINDLPLPLFFLELDSANKSSQLLLPKKNANKNPKNGPSKTPNQSNNLQKKNSIGKQNDRTTK